MDTQIVGKLDEILLSNENVRNSNMCSNMDETQNNDGDENTQTPCRSVAVWETEAKAEKAKVPESFSKCWAWSSF